MGSSAFPRNAEDPGASGSRTRAARGSCRHAHRCAGTGSRPGSRPTAPPAPRAAPSPTRGGAPMSGRGASALGGGQSSSSEYHRSWPPVSGLVVRQRSVAMSVPSSTTWLQPRPYLDRAGSAGRGLGRPARRCPRAGSGSRWPPCGSGGRRHAHPGPRRRSLALLIAERRRRGTGVGARAATCRTQAILLLRPIVSRRTPPLVLRHTSSRRRAATSAPQNGVSRQSV